MRNVLGLFLLALTLSACSNSSRHEVNYSHLSQNDFPVLTAIGYAPIETQPAKSREERTLLAMRASKLDAYRELAEQLYGLEVMASYEQMSQTMVQDNMQTQVQGVIRGAEIIRSYPVGDHYATEVRLDTKRLHTMEQLNTEQQSIEGQIEYY